MSEYLAKKIVNKMIINNVVDDKNTDAYQYAVQLLIEKCIGFILIYIFALVAGKTVETSLFLITYLTIRRYSGGYHCKTDIGCLFLSLIYVVVSVCFEIPFLINHRISADIIFASSIVFMLIAGPINHPNMNWSKDEYIAIKKRFFLVVLVWLVIITCVELIDVPKNIIIYLYVGVINASFLMMISKILKQEVKQYDEKI